MTMHCDCGHSLRTIEEQDDGQCIRCSSKVATHTDINMWRVAGSLAYDDGIVRAPLMDSAVMDAIKAGGDVLGICETWLKGWDDANLTDDIE